ncbi:MAG: hypothetical protein ACREBS_06955 [Nitrososphaerales archaeon]
MPVGVFYYLWYGFNYTTNTWTGGLGTTHWNQSDGISATIVKDKPTIGWYSSMSNATLSYQIPLMLKAGISFVTVSWWGWGNNSLEHGGFPNTENEAVNNATLNLLKWIKGTDSSIKVAILVDAFNTTDFREAQYSQIRNYIDNEFYLPYAEEIFNWEGAPLIGWFNPLDPITQGFGHNPNFTDRVIGANPYVSWTFWSGDAQFMQGTDRSSQDIAYNEGGPAISSMDSEVSVIPRFDDYYLTLAGSRALFMRFDTSYSAGMYNYDWNYVQQNEKRISLVMIYSWNEYHERSEIEPHTDFSAGVNSTYAYNITGYCVNQLEHGFASGNLTENSASAQPAAALERSALPSTEQPSQIYYFWLILVIVAIVGVSAFVLRPKRSKVT